jgi:predicted NBD/HSP70 family sugar kinase
MKGKGMENIIFLTFGTGMDAGLILNGRLYRGTYDISEIDAKTVCIAEAEFFDA